MSVWEDFSLIVKGKSDDYYIDGFVDFLRNLTFQMQLPGLNRYGIEEKDIRKDLPGNRIKEQPCKIKSGRSD